MTETLTLRLSCDDRPGLVVKVSGFLAGEGGNIIEAQQFDDRRRGVGQHAVGGADHAHAGGHRAGGHVVDA